MIIITRPGVTEGELDYIRERVEVLGMRTHISRGEHHTVIGCIGDESLLQEASLLSLPGVEQVIPVMKPYRLASREFVADPSVVRVGDVGGASFGGREFTGKVDSVAGATGARFSLLPPENATGNVVKVVQRVPVKIVLEPGQDPEHRLRPGMSAGSAIQWWIVARPSSAIAPIISSALKVR